MTNTFFLKKKIVGGGVDTKILHTETPTLLIADGGAFTGAGAVASVHYAVCCLLQMKILQLKQDESNNNFIFQNNFFLTNSLSAFLRPN